MPKERAEGDSRADGHTRAKDDARAVDREKGLRIRLFDADRTDEALTLEEALNAQVSGRQILWIDVEGELQAESLRAMVERFGFDEATERVLAEPSSKPHIQLHGKHFLSPRIGPSSARSVVRISGLASRPPTPRSSPPSPVASTGS